MKIVRVLKQLLAVGLLAGAGYAGYTTRARWLPVAFPQNAVESEEAADDPAAPVTKVIVNEQAQLNLGLTAKPLIAQTFWKTISVPGMVVDRPGVSDRNLVAPAAGVVAKIHHVPGDSVRPGAALFTLKLIGDSLHLTQTELFKATQDIKLAQAQKKLMQAASGAISEARIIEVGNAITRLEVAAKAYRLELLNRGFAAEQIDGVAEGKFVNEMTVAVPARSIELLAQVARTSLAVPTDPPSFEMQELKVDLGQHVQAGQTLCLLANHQYLAVEGRAFRDETPLLEKSVREKWPVEIDFQEDAAADWGDAKQSFYIRHLANSIDPLTRTFAFSVPLENQSKIVSHDGRSQTLWRYRPGQKVRMLVRIEEVKNVFVLPADAVARDGVEAFVFTQNVNTFERVPVRVLLQDRNQAVLVHDGSMPTGTFAVQSGASQLNRMVKAGGASGVPKGYHIHADGSLHKNEDEGK